MIWILRRLVDWWRGPITQICPRCLLPLEVSLRDEAVLEREAMRAHRAGEDLLCCFGSDGVCQMAEITPPYDF